MGLDGFFNLDLSVRWNLSMFDWIVGSQWERKSEKVTEATHLRVQISIGLFGGHQKTCKLMFTKHFSRCSSHIDTAIFH